MKRGTLSSAPGTPTSWGLGGIFRSRIMVALGSLFNFLLLNLALLITSLPVVTLPLAVVATWTALDRWRCDGEDRVVREFLRAFRSSSTVTTTLLVGVPLALTAVAAEEVHYFAHGGGVVARVCFGLGLSALSVALSALGYVFLLVARHPSALPSSVWSLCIRLALRNILVTGPPFLIEIVGATLLALLNPALLLIGLPLGLFCLMRLTAQFGVRRACETQISP